MLLNVVVGFEGYGIKVVGEIQIHYRPILELKENEMHLFYEMERAAAIAELIPKDGATPAPAASADRRVSELEAKLAAKDAALKEKETELAKKQAALAEKDAEL